MNAETLRVQATRTLCPELDHSEIMVDALVQAMEPDINNRMLADFCCAFSDFNIVDQPRITNTHGRQPPPMQIFDIIYIETLLA